MLLSLSFPSCRMIRGVSKEVAQSLPPVILLAPTGANFVQFHFHVLLHKNPMLLVSHRPMIPHPGLVPEGESQASAGAAEPLFL